MGGGKIKKRLRYFVDLSEPIIFAPISEEIDRLILLFAGLNIETWFLVTITSSVGFKVSVTGTDCIGKICMINIGWLVKVARFFCRFSGFSYFCRLLRNPYCG